MARQVDDDEDGEDGEDVADEVIRQIDEDEGAPLPYVEEAPV